MTKDSLKSKVITENKYFDTTANLFSDTSYKVHLRFMNPDQNDSIGNSVLTFLHNKDVLLKDSLFCPFSIFDVTDMNNDGVEDMLIINNSSARSNEGFYLYLTDTVQKKLIRVDGFESVHNPSLDTVNNIISTSAFWGGSETCEFYRISRQNKLINLGYSFDHLVEEDKLYNKAIRKILKKWGRK